MLSKTFILAGDATFTIECPDATHHTFRVQHVEKNDRWPESFFVKMLTGPDNENSYSYLGKLNDFTGQVVLTAKSKLTADSFTYRLLNRILARIWGDDAASFEQHGYKVHHEGRCGKCGRKLTVPASVESGIGPECSKQMGLVQRIAKKNAKADDLSDFDAAIQAQDRADEERRCEFKMLRDAALRG